MLPNEKEGIGIIRNRFADIFNATKQLLSLSLGLCEGKFEAEVDKLTLHAATNLYVSACKKYRQAIALCEFGQCDGSEIIIRSLFETVLTLGFVCKKSVVLRSSSGGGEIGYAAELQDDRSKRSHLYFAYLEIQYQKWIEKMGNIPGREEWSNERLQETDTNIKKDLVSNYDDKGWYDRLKKSTTCSGLNVPDLAYSLGEGTYHTYLRAYSRQSATTHASWGNQSTIPLKNETGASITWSDTEIFQQSPPLRLSSCLLALSGEYYAKLSERAGKIPAIRAALTVIEFHISELDKQAGSSDEDAQHSSRG